MKFIEKVKSFFEKIGTGWTKFKTKMKNPKWLQKKKEEKLEAIEAVDLSSLSKPVNDVETSGPKKMKNFSEWASWKTILVGAAGVGAVIFIWWLYSYICEINNTTSFLSSPAEVWKQFITLSSNGILWKHLGSSIGRILVGYGIALVTSIPIAFLMAWYKPVRAFFDPFIQFLRCIPPLAYVPVVIAALGLNESAKYFIIFLVVFLTMTVTIYQGVRNIDLTLVKAAYTFGARDKNLFGGVIVPSAFPFILTAMRLGVGAAMTTLIAAETISTTYGLGAYIANQGSVFRMDRVIMGIIILGLFGIIFDKVLLYIEKSLTRWK